MNQPKLITLTSLLFSVLLFFSGCSENTLTPEKLAETEQGGTWVFSGFVIDYYGTSDSNGNAIVEVTISTINNGKTVTAKSDENGFFSIGDLSPGVHTFKFEKEGFETIYNYSPGNGQNQSIGKFYNVENATINMYKNNGSVSGKAYMLSENDTRVAADGARIRIDVGSSYRPRYRYATANSDGEFSLSNLPRVNVTITMEHQDFSGVTYGYVNTNGSDLSKNVDLAKKSNAGVLDLRRVFADVIQALSNNFVGKKMAGDTVRVGFDVGIDPSTIEVSAGGRDFNYSLSNDDKDVTIALLEKFYAGTSYTIRVEGMTKEGKSFSWSKTLETPNPPMIKSSNLLGDDGEPVKNFSPTDTGSITLDQEITGANPASSLMGKIKVMIDSNKLSFIPLVPISDGTRNTLAGSLNIETKMGNLFNLDIPNFTLAPTISLVSSNVLDRNLNGLRDVSQNEEIVVMLSDSVKSIVKNSSSYPEYDMTLDSTGTKVTIKRNRPFNVGSSYSFYIYGTMANGQTFSVFHSTFYTKEEKTIGIQSSNVLDSNLNGLYDVEKNVEVTVVLSDSVQSLVKTHPSYTDWEMTLGSDGRTVTVKKLNGYLSGSSYNFAIYGVTAMGNNFSVSHSSFRIREYPAVRIARGTALDSNLNGIQNVPAGKTVKVWLSDSVASMIKTHASYADYDVMLGADGKEVTITRLNGGFLPGGSYNFYIYGVNRIGESFSLHHTTFRVADIPTVRIASSSHLDTNLNGKQAVPLSMDTITVVLSDSVKSIVPNHPSYTDWDLDLQADGKTIKVTKRTPMTAGNSYSFAIYGVNQQGENFSTSHTTWRMNSFVLLWSNIQNANLTEKFGVPVTQVIKMVFNKNLDGNRKPSISWTSYSGEETISVSGDTLTITPTESFEEKTRIRIYLSSIYSTDGHTGSAVSIYFNTVNNSKPPKAVTGFALDTAGSYSANIPKDGGLGGGMPVMWNEMDSVTTYRIYAVGKNDGNTNWKLITTVSSQYAGGAIYGKTTITNAMLSEFSRVTSRPLSMADNIRLIISAINGEGEGPTSGDTILLRDDIAVGRELVTGSYVNQHSSISPTGGTWNNATGSSVTREITVTFPEWMDTSVDPTITYTEAGGDPAAIASAGASKWEWLTKTQGKFVVTIPANTNWSGDTYKISIVGMKDNSGNESKSNNYTTDIGSSATTP